MQLSCIWRERQSERERESARGKEGGREGGGRGRQREREREREREGNFEARGTRATSQVTFAPALEILTYSVGPEECEEEEPTWKADLGFYEWEARSRTHCSDILPLPGPKSM